MFVILLEYTVIGAYLLCLTLIVLYSLGQLHLVWTFYRRRADFHPIPPLAGEEGLPMVTIQLPIYNELYVVERLLEAVGRMNYPKERFEIQVLDDSDDETVPLAARKVAELEAQGIQIAHIRRPSREGFKAGALAYGLEIAQGDFIAIFDADFLPHPNFLRATLPYFTEPGIGVVQARWEHINQHYSFFTEAQAFHLDAHFTVEQFSRSYGGYYMNFNGTAGVWRKACIYDAGGWQADTLTEDLDLSYRAQIKGWKFRYIDSIGAPAELPAQMNAIKGQQYRWMKGGAEVARKMLRQLWRSDASLIRKIHGSLHLLSSSVFIIVFVLSLLTVPLLYVKHEYFQGEIGILTVPFAFLALSFFLLLLFYLVTMLNREKSLGKSLKRLGIYFLPFLAFSIGLSLHNTIAVLQGYWGKKTPFIRTPKFNIRSRSDSWRKGKYLPKKIKPEVLGELIFALYILAGIYLSLHFRDLAVLPFLLLQFIGFSAIGLASLRR